ncbi:GspH/FimT family pseudopilin [Diaphorobacter aerolatus]|uniref:Type II secretion system protein H n=1 Tax=Diaphorobacter aerolatus TaxID=1288495 RepID=A0A7H0GFT1_9BURK|nr:GspH/FimT family pseudopilin [Diaphorobacter aerolatus]QNP47147.1 GspH/FimT family pseudopilin [Diaphorobacter aerolatus]
MTLSVLAILLVVAAPSFASLWRVNRATAAVKRFSLDLEYARSEARRRGSAVSLCASEGTACQGSGGADWAKGWIVFADDDADGSVDGGEAILRVQPALTGGDTFQAGDGRSSLTMGRTGLASNLSASVTFTLHTSPIDANATRCALINRAGRETVLKAGATGCA